MRDNQQVPAIAENVAHVASDMPVAAILGGEQIATPGIETAIDERAPDGAGKFAGYENLAHRPNTQPKNPRRGCSIGRIGPRMFSRCHWLSGGRERVR